MSLESPSDQTPQFSGVLPDVVIGQRRATCTDLGHAYQGGEACPQGISYVDSANSMLDGAWMLDKTKIDAFDEFVEQFSKESDRAAVILAVSKLDQQLYFLLLRYLLPPYSKNDDLLTGDSPISTFSARINLCYRLGLLDIDFAKTLHQVRKIRNDFAHKLDVHLDRAPVRDHVKVVIQAVDNSELFDDVKEVYFPDSTRLTTQFYVALTVLAARLETLCESITTLDNNKAASVVPSTYSQANLS